MVNKILSKGRKLLISPQGSVLSAATVIMLMVVASRVLGLIRQRTLAHFFTPNELSLFFAAFRLPDTIFEVLVFGTFSSAFIPVFSRSLSKGNRKAWETAAVVVNIGLIVFAILALVAGFSADKIYSLFTPGYSLEQRVEIVRVARLLFFAQGFFVISYVLTGVLESLRRFLVPALAPLFYNIGIILGTIIFVSNWGLLAPAMGVLLGAFSHLFVQLPLAFKLGFRFGINVKPNKEVRQIGKLALPRVIELSFIQVSKTVELYLSSLISTASYTYFTFANTLQLLPVGLFGVSVSKAALPTLSRQADKPEKFKRTLYSSLYQIVFLVLPLSTIIIVLRIPIVRLVFGTQIFSWEATVQTGMVLSAFGFGVVFQSVVALLSRSFYALHDTKTPVVVSITAMLLVILTNFLLIRRFSVAAWGLAAAFSLGNIFQAITLFRLINEKIKQKITFSLLVPVFKSTLSAVGSGVTMYVLLKIFDRSVWVKRLSFLGRLESTQVINFENFVLDTRYTANLLVLVIMVSLVGTIIYFGLSIILKNREVWTFFNLIKRIMVKRKVSPIPSKEPEPVTPTPTDTSGS